MWWRENRRKFLILAVGVAVLAAAFLWGGNAPGSPDQAGESATPATVPARSAVTPAPSGPEPSKTHSGPAPSVSPTPTPDAAEPSPSPVAEEPEAEEGPACTLSILCDAALDHMDALPEEQRALIPQDGVILAPAAVSFEAGESAFDLLQRVCREREIHMEFSDTPLYHCAYIEGIQNLYELDCGALSGWMYQVNGQFPNYSCSQYTVEDGDVIRWMYTCDLGEDIGGQDAAGQRGE